MLIYDLRPAGSGNRYRRAVQLDPSIQHCTRWPAVTGSAPLSIVHFYAVQSAAVADYCSALFQDLV